ncbi:MAG: hypothetical protein V4558_01925 [Gemmatimonadota bacterium]
MVLRLQAEHGEFSGDFRLLYSESEVVPPLEEVADLTYQLRPTAPGLWTWLVNGAPTQRSPFPAPLVLTHFEWAIHDSVTWALAPAIGFHAAVVANSTGAAVALVASSGSGKSTLAAGMVAAGWYLVADEFFVTSPDGSVVPMPGPITLKNESIELIRARGGPLVIGPTVHDPARGALAHVRPAVRLPSDLRVDVRSLVFPTFGLDERLLFDRVTPPYTFQQLTLQSQNKHLLGIPGFRMLSRVARIPAWKLQFNALSQAIEAVASSLDAGI